ncbi:hypothetical protein BT63DRAFT_422716 [Microthyrium microscopicum]|uniref:Uncharacterized protein n=1 Tax=Microthyrium microscopicum TaxID=703497 RepID=A0A6A6UJ15_9PEZI|nr:hypothetical protein BT63DRAFT_422716 [Microthyrium microscopicum]
MASETTQLVDSSTENTTKPTTDPFAAQREGNDFDSSKIAGSDDMAMPPGEGEGSPTTGRRESREWDASKVPPSQFQKRKGSIYSTPNSRDGHVHGAGERDKAYFDKLKEKGWHMVDKVTKDTK